MKHIALAMGLSDYYDHGIARGIVRYAKTKPGWRLYGHGWMFSPLDDLRGWDGDGVIARIEYAETATLLEGVTCPVVDVANAFSAPHIHLVSNDDAETGRLAGRHFRKNGFKSVAYCGVSHAQWSLRRLQGFTESLGSDDVPIFERPLSWWLQERHSVELALFLARLPKPVALFACNDKVGLRVSSICSAEQIAVPDQVAVLGVDNEDIPCELANPTLSSIELQLEQIGERAAATLHLLMEHPERAVPNVLVPPVDVVERRSTLAYASANPLIVEAYRRIRSDGGHVKSVKDVADEVAVSRRTLENHFKRETGQTVHEAIIAQKIRIATHLLRSTDLKMEAIAGEAGFGSLQRFFAHFKRYTGTTPNRFRKLTGSTPRKPRV